jgi:hypothetical protein
MIGARVSLGPLGQRSFSSRYPKPRVPRTTHLLSRMVAVWQSAGLVREI